MRSSIKKMITTTAIGAFALSGLTACVVSNDPYVNTAATAAVTAGAVGMLLYAVNDGYYYDQDYNRMPRNYRPAQNVQVVRVNNIHEYRRTHPRPTVVHHHHTQQTPQYQQNRPARTPEHVWQNDNAHRSTPVRHYR